MSAHCPACNSTESTRYPYDNHQRRWTPTSLKHSLGALLFRLGIHSPWLRRRLLFGPTQDILRCDQCGHGRYERDFKEGELEGYYRHRYFLADGLPRESWDDLSFFEDHCKTQGQWAFVRPHLDGLSQLRLLDIGAAASRISRMARLHYKDRAQCAVVEPGEGWTDYYAHHHIRVAGRFFPCPDDQLYDYIHTSHWLEHVEKIEPVMQAMRARLATGGLCFIEVPNCNADYFALDFPDQPHIHFFTAESLTQSMRNHGFEPVDVRECALPMPDYLHYRRLSDNMPEAAKRKAQETEASIAQVPGGNLLRGLFRAAS